MSRHWTIKEHRELIKSVHRRTSGLKRKRGSASTDDPHLSVEANSGGRE